MPVINEINQLCLFVYKYINYKFTPFVVCCIGSHAWWVDSAQSTGNKSTKVLVVHYASDVDGKIFVTESNWLILGSIIVSLTDWIWMPTWLKTDRHCLISFLSLFYCRLDSSTSVCSNWLRSVSDLVSGFEATVSKPRRMQVDCTQSQ